MPESTVITPLQRLNELLATPGVKGRFQEMLKDRAPSFISSIISSVRANKSLSECDPMSVITAAATAASLDLSISLGQAYIVPYKGLATFQMGWSGYVQLFLRTGQAKSINALEIHDGDIKSIDRLTGEVELTPEEHLDSPVLGYLSCFKLTNGFQHYLYMTKEMVEAHAKRYSQSYGYDLREGKKTSKWSTDFGPMALKTVTKMNLKKYAPLSIEMRSALEEDEAIDVGGERVFPDAPQLSEAQTALSPSEPKTVSSKLAQAVATPVAIAPAVTASDAHGDAYEPPQEQSLPL